MRVVHELTKSRKSKAVSYYVNAMQLKTPAGLYAHLLYSLFGVRKRAAQVLGELNRLLLMEESGRSKPVRILILDEMDFLITKDQQVLYNLFEWTQHSSSRLAVLAIANTMDVPEKLQPKVLSRLGDSRLVFGQYSSEQLQLIVHSRLRNFPIFSDSAVKFACRRLCSMSTDVRKILLVLSHAVRLFLQQPDSPHITVEHIKQSFEEISPLSAASRALQSLSLIEQRCMIMVVLEERISEKCLVTNLVRRLASSQHEGDQVARIVRVLLGIRDLGLLEVKYYKGLDEMAVKAVVGASELREGIAYEELEKYKQIL